MTQPGPVGPAPPELAGALPAIRTILEGALAGREVGEADAVTLFAASGRSLAALLATADYVRQRTVGDRATFVVTRNINFTNVCYMGCTFCNFAKRADDPAAELLSFDEIARRAEEALQRGATEVCIQGGLHPKLPGGHYKAIVEAIKARVPDIHIHAFSPFEIWYGAHKSRQSPATFLQDLMAAGLGSIPGTAAEILDVEIRRRLTKDKLTTDQWVAIVKAAHRVGLASTSTMMYGHIDGPRHWAAHIALLREIQKETGGFTEFVPLGFVHYDSPLYLRNNDVRPGPSADESLRVHAVARLMLAGWIDNIQVSWVKLGPQLAQQILRCGANDLGGTLMNESISRAAGARHGQEITPREMSGIIRGAGLVPTQRSTLYRHLAVYETDDPPDYSPLVPRTEPSGAALLAQAQAKVPAPRSTAAAAP